MAIAIYEIRAIVETFVDMFYNQTQDTTPDDAPTVIDIVNSLKSISYANVYKSDELLKLHRENGRIFGGLYNQFLSQGMQFLIMHVLSLWDESVLSRLRDSLISSAVASRVLDFNSEFATEDMGSHLTAAFRAQPWLLFQMLLQITAIDQADPDDKNGSVTNE